MPKHLAHDDDFEDNEDWYDDETDDANADDETVSCPECAAPLHELADACPRCGYFLTDDDRRRLGFGHSKPLWIKITTVVILVVLLCGLFELSTFFF